MADKSKGLEWKVGVFVFLGLAVLSWFVLMIGDLKLMRIGRSIQVCFGFANGIKVGAPVRIAGVDKGEVKEIKLTHTADGKTVIYIRAWVDGAAQVPRDSRAWVNTLGLLGEKYLEIIPGQDYKDSLKEGDILLGEDPTSVQEVTDLAKDVTLQAQATLTDLQKTLKSLDGVLTDMRDGRGTVGKFFTDDRLYNDLEEMFADLKKNPWKLLYRPKGTE
jgi:phospholipid/cholesterol/gamma-HCH transport system substrate-binding protein